MGGEKKRVRKGEGTARGRKDIKNKLKTEQQTSTKQTAKETHQTLVSQLPPAKTGTPQKKE